MLHAEKFPASHKNLKRHASEGGYEDSLLQGGFPLAVHEPGRRKEDDEGKKLGPGQRISTTQVFSRKKQIKRKGDLSPVEELG